MEIYLQHLINHSTSYALMAIVLIAFLESLALVGLFLPGTLMMAFLGTLIGSGQVGLLSACAAGTLGALLGDWLSFFGGRFFKKSWVRFSLVQRYHGVLNRAEQALGRRSFVTILLGRLIGPTRPVVPLVAGMLQLAPTKFIFPNLIGCLIWPLIYFMPGIMAGVAVALPAHPANQALYGLLLMLGVLLGLAGWLGWHSLSYWRCLTHQIPAGMSASRLHLLTVIAVLGVIGGLLLLIRQPLFTLYSQQLWLVFSR